MSDTDKIMGLSWDEIQALQQRLPRGRRTVNTQAPGDYGCDPLPDGTYRMVPSGDIVSAQERDTRLSDLRTSVDRRFA